MTTSQSLSVIIVTSPLQCHPSTELIDRLILSLNLLRGLEQVNCVSAHRVPAQIVTDGCLQPGSAGSKKTKRNAGIDEERINAYGEYKRRLLRRFGRTCERCGCGCTCNARCGRQATCTASPLSWLDLSVTELDGWHGFGWALRHALTLVHTPHVLVLPHDMEFEQPIDVAALCAILADDSAGVHYIGFANPNLLNYPERVRAKSGIALTPLAFPAAATDLREPTLLLPLFRWKENPHLANVRQYFQFVFGPNSWPKVKRGQFIEETIGQRQNDLILKEGGVDGWREAHAPWGTYLYWPMRAEVKQAEKNDTSPNVGLQQHEHQPHLMASARVAPTTFAVTHHLDGHTYRTVGERLAAGHTPHAFEIERSSEAARLFDAVDGHGGK